MCLLKSYHIYQNSHISLYINLIKTDRQAPRTANLSAYLSAYLPATRLLHDYRDCYENAHKEQNLPLKDFSRACVGMVVATIGENVSHTGQNSLLPMRLFIPNPSFRTSFRSLITCRAVWTHTSRLVVLTDVLTNLRIGTKHRSWG